MNGSSMAWKQPLTIEKTNKIKNELKKDIPMKYIATDNHVCVQTVRETMTTTEQKLKSFEEMKIRMNRKNNSIDSVKAGLIVYDLFTRVSTLNIIKNRKTSSQSITKIKKSLSKNSCYNKYRL